MTPRSFQRAHNARRLRFVAVDNRRLLKSDLKISRAYFAGVASWQGLTRAALKMNVHHGIRIIRAITGYKSPFASHYVPLRIKKRRSSIILSERHRYVGRPPPPIEKQHHVEDLRAGTRTPLVFAYRRIAKHVIHLRQVYPDIAGILPAVRRGRQATTSAPPRLWYIVLH